MRRGRDGALGAAVRWWESWALGALLTARVGLAAMLGPGRDELAYWWWAWNGLDASYSLATAALLRISTTLLGDGVFAMRLPGLLAGVAAIALTIRLARTLGASDRAAVGAGLAIAASPWQGYAGTVVHPDAFLLPAVLGVGAALMSGEAGDGDAGRRLPAAAGVAILGAMAKLSGLLLVVPVAAFAWGRRKTAAAGAWGAAAILAAGTAVLVASRDEGVLTGLRELGRFDPNLSGMGRIPWISLEIGLLAGPGLLVGAFAGIGAAGTLRRGRVAMATGLPFLLGFATFLAMGQGKGNWFLPGLAIFVPWGFAEAERRGHSRGLRILTGLGVVGTLLLGALWSLPHRPDLWASTKESAMVRRLDSSYLAHAGPRERAVSTTRSWTERIEEYGPGSPIDPRLTEAWGDGAAAILSNDYGLAFRAARELGRGTMVLLPWDPIFRRRCGGEPAPGEDVVFLSRHREGIPTEWEARFREIETFPPVEERECLTVMRGRKWIGTKNGGKE